MRQKLQTKENQRMTFTAKFKRYGTKTNWHGFPEKTILLTGVKDKSGKVMTDHIWFSLTKGFQRLGELQEGDIIQRVSPGHTMIITGVAGGTAFVTYHTPNTYYENFRYFVNSHNPAEYVAYHLDATG